MIGGKSNIRGRLLYLSMLLKDVTLQMRFSLKKKVISNFPPTGRCKVGVLFCRHDQVLDPLFISFAKVTIRCIEARHSRNYKPESKNKEIPSFVFPKPTHFCNWKKLTERNILGTLYSVVKKMVKYHKVWSINKQARS